MHAEHSRVAQASALAVDLAYKLYLDSSPESIRIANKRGERFMNRIYQGCVTGVQAESGETQRVRAAIFQDGKPVPLDTWQPVLAAIFTFSKGSP